MTLFVFETELYQQYPPDQVRELQSTDPDIWTGHLNDPKQVSQGYRQYTNLSPGLWLQVDDYTLHEDLVVETMPHKPQSLLELSFSVLGSNRTEQVAQGYNFLAAYVQEASDGNYFHWKAGDRALKFDIHIDFQLLQPLMLPQQQLPTELVEVLQTMDERTYWTGGKTTPLMQAIVQQILTCPYRGIIQKIYLEAKVMELLALRLAEVAGQAPPPLDGQRLRPEQVEQIYRARDILLNRLSNPPSLTELARQVGLNDCTLKQGFRQVLHTTAFGYLREQRMEWARSLLRDRRLKVKEVAHIVGYINPSQFSAAFKRQFGVKPSDYRLTGRLG